MTNKKNWYLITIDQSKMYDLENYLRVIHKGSNYLEYQFKAYKARQNENQELHYYLQSEYQDFYSFVKLRFAITPCEEPGLDFLENLIPVKFGL